MNAGGPKGLREPRLRARLEPGPFEEHIGATHRGKAGGCNARRGGCNAPHPGVELQTTLPRGNAQGRTTMMVIHIMATVFFKGYGLLLFFAVLLRPVAVEVRLLERPVA